VLSGCRSTQPQFAEVAALVEDARAAARVGDFGGAAIHWNQVRRIDPARGSEPHLELARSLLALNERERALDALEFGIEFFPEDGELRRARGHLLVELGFRRAAEADFAAACEAFPQDPLVWCELAEVRAELGFDGAAVEAYERAVVLPGRPHVVLAAAARANARAERRARAHELFAAALAEAPEDVGLLADAAANALAWGTLEPLPEDEAEPRAAALGAARAWARRACELDPQHVAAHVTAGRLWSLAGDDTRAAEALRRALEVDNLSSAAALALARVEARRGRTAAAEEAYGRLLALAPDDADAELWRAELAALAPGAATPIADDASAPPTPADDAAPVEPPGDGSGDGPGEAPGGEPVEAPTAEAPAPKGATSGGADAVRDPAQDAPRGSRARPPVWR
jgi:tetratricopeptide (TPR) repeat protein